MTLPIKTVPFECVRAFAAKRSEGLSLSFLKENGELLSIALSSGMTINDASLALYHELYEKIDKLCELYPPFFRFFLGITLDLEDLGMPGNQGEKLIEFVLKNDLYAYDVSDTRRMEIINLLERRGRAPNYETDPKKQLFNRMIGFMERPERFIKFNRPLFYDLTHLIFFGTNFGNQKIPHSEKIFESLNHIGMLAYLDDDEDLLSEVCLCFIFLGRKAPQIWIDASRRGLEMIDIQFPIGPKNSADISGDDYHIYLVTSWLQAVSGRDIFQEKFENATPKFVQKKTKNSTLSKIFQTLHPMVLESGKGQINQIVNVSTILSTEDSRHLENAFSAFPESHDFLEKLTNGRISAF